MRTNKRIVWKMPNGGIAFTTPGDTHPRLEGESEDAYLDRIAELTRKINGWHDWVRLPNVDKSVQEDRAKRATLTEAMIRDEASKEGGERG